MPGLRLGAGCSTSVRRISASCIFALTPRHSLITPEVSSAHVVTDVLKQWQEEAERRERRAKQRFESFCRRAGLVVAGTPSLQLERSARWLRENSSESYWFVE